MSRPTDTPETPDPASVRFGLRPAPTGIDLAEALSEAQGQLVELFRLAEPYAAQILLAGGALPEYPNMEGWHEVTDKYCEEAQDLLEYHESTWEAIEEAGQEVTEEAEHAQAEEGKAWYALGVAVGIRLARGLR